MRVDSKHGVILGMQQRPMACNLTWEIAFILHVSLT